MIILIDFSILSTDSSKIIKLAKKNKIFCPFVRPDRLSKDNSKIYEYTFPKNKLQKEVTNILLKKGTSISKVLNTQAFSIRDLKRSFVVDKNININQLN